MGKLKAIPGFGDVVCFRGYGGLETNVPQRLVKHSPSGFGWNYGGSGPADFALNILAVYIGQEKAERNGLYQLFKVDFIQTLPFEGGTIKRADVMKWVKRKIEERREVGYGNC